MDTSRRPHILLVDDDISTIQVLWCLLSDEAQIRFARSAGQALELAREQTPDLILLDLELPDGSGLDLCRRLRQEPAALAAVPVLIVTAHGGDEHQVAALDVGAADFIRKPLQGEQLLARVRAQLRERHGAAPLPASAPGAGDRPLRVLIVDDDVVAIKMLRNALEALSVQFHFTTRGEEALRLASRLRPDIILLDAQLPGLDGFEVCRRLKADAALAATPVIFVTRSDDPITEAMALEAGAVDFIGKPYRPAVLKARVQHALRPRAAAAQAGAAAPALEAEAAARSAAIQSTLTTLADTQPDALLLLDGSGRVEWLNAAAGRLLALPETAGVGQDVDRLWRSVQRLDSAQPAWPPGPMGPPSGTDPPQPWRLTRLDGRPVDLLATWRRHPVGDRSLTSLLLQAPTRADRDLTDETPSKLLTLHRLVALARSAATELLQLGGTGQAEALREAARQPASLLRDIEDLLGLAPDLPPAQYVAVDLADCLARARNAVQATRLQCELAPTLPPVASDALRLQRALERLLDSARSSPVARLRVTVETDRVSLTFTAAGWDWSPAQLLRLRWPLPGAEAAPTQADRTALGLAVTHHLLTALGAEIELDAPGAGAGAGAEAGMPDPPGVPAPPGEWPVFRMRLPRWGAQPGVDPALQLPD